MSDTDAVKLDWLAWSAIGLVFALMIFVLFGATLGRPVGNLEQYTLLAQSLPTLLFIVPLAMALALRKRRRLRPALAITLLAVLLFFFMAPVIPMVETSTYSGPPGGSCCVFVTYGSISHGHSCIGATTQRWTTDCEGYAFQGYSLWAGCLFL